MNFLEYIKIADYILGFCSDTIVSNIGWKSGAITILSKNSWSTISFVTV